MKRILLLGAGRIGQVHAKNIVGHPAAGLYAVVDVNASAAKSLAEATGAKVYETAELALDDPKVDGVMICSSTDTHVDLILASAKAKKPIFCEKPVDLDMERVTGCLAEVAKAGVPLFMGFNRRFDPSFRAIRDRAKRGEIGEVESVHITSRDPSPPPPAYVKVSGGLFRDMMIHDFDMARFLLPDEPVEVFAQASVLVDPSIGEAGDVDSAIVVLKTASGRLCSITNSRRAVYGYDQRLEVFGSKGMLQADNLRPTSVVKTGAESGATEDKPLHFFLERYDAAYRAELEHFLAVIEGKERPLVTGEDGRKALALAEAAKVSLETGKAVRL